MSGTLWPGNGILAHRAIRRQTCGAGVPPGLRRQPRRLPRTSTSATRSRASRADDRSRPALRPSVGRGAAEQHAGEPGVPVSSCPASSSPATTRRSPGTTCRRAPASPTRSTRRARRSRARASAATPASSKPAPSACTNPSSTAGSATYRWVDLNGDHFAQANEVNLNQFITRGRRVQPRQSDGGHVGERPRSEPRGAA